MPWKETSTMDQRIQFIADHLRGLYTKKALCRHYGISRPTGDKWIERYRIDGAEGLCERSRRPHWPPPQLPRPDRHRPAFLRRAAGGRAVPGRPDLGPEEATCDAKYCGEAVPCKPSLPSPGRFQPKAGNTIFLTVRFPVLNRL